MKGTFQESPTSRKTCRYIIGGVSSPVYYFFGYRNDQLVKERGNMGQQSALKEFKQVIAIW